MKNQVIDVIKRTGIIAAPAGQKFTLASGATTDYYVDCRRITLDPIGLDVIIDAIASKINNIDYNVIGGLTLGADPIVAGLLSKFGPKSKRKGFIVRKEYKAHGMRNIVEGHLKEGDNAIIVEDAVSSGGSVFKAIAAVEERGAKVVKIVAIIDRLEGASTVFNKRGYEYDPLVTVNDLFDAPILEER